MILNTHINNNQDKKLKANSKRIMPLKPVEVPNLLKIKPVYETKSNLIAKKDLNTNTNIRTTTGMIINGNANLHETLTSKKLILNKNSTPIIIDKDSSNSLNNLRKDSATNKKATEPYYSSSNNHISKTTTVEDSTSTNDIMMNNNNADFGSSKSSWRYPNNILDDSSFRKAVIKKEKLEIDCDKDIESDKKFIYHSSANKNILTPNLLKKDYQEKNENLNNDSSFNLDKSSIKCCIEDKNTQLLISNAWGNMSKNITDLPSQRLALENCINNKQSLKDSQPVTNEASKNIAFVENVQNREINLDKKSPNANKNSNSVIYSKPNKHIVEDTKLNLNNFSQVKNAYRNTTSSRAAVKEQNLPKQKKYENKMSKSLSSFKFEFDEEDILNISSATLNQKKESEEIFNKIVNEQIVLEFHEVFDFLESLGLEKYLEVILKNGMDTIDKMIFGMLYIF